MYLWKTETPDGLVRVTSLMNGNDRQRILKFSKSSPYATLRFSDFEVNIEKDCGTGIGIQP